MFEYLHFVYSINNKKKTNDSQLYLLSVWVPFNCENREKKLKKKITTTSTKTQNIPNEMENNGNEMQWTSIYKIVRRLYSRKEHKI